MSGTSTLVVLFLPFVGLLILALLWFLLQPKPGRGRSFLEKPWDYADWAWSWDETTLAPPEAHAVLIAAFEKLGIKSFAVPGWPLCAHIDKGRIRLHAHEMRVCGLEHITKHFAEIVEQAMPPILADRARRSRLLERIREIAGPVDDYEEVGRPRRKIVFEKDSSMKELEEIGKVEET